MLEPGGTYPELADGKEGRRAGTSGFTSIGPVRSGSPFESGESTQRASMKVGKGVRRGVLGAEEGDVEQAERTASCRGGVARPVQMAAKIALDRSARLCSTRARSSKAGRSIVRPA